MYIASYFTWSRRFLARNSCLNQIIRFLNSESYSLLFLLFGLQFSPVFILFSPPLSPTMAHYHVSVPYNYSMYSAWFCCGINLLWLSCRNEYKWACFVFVLSVLWSADKLASHGQSWSNHVCLGVRNEITCYKQGYPWVGYR